MDISNLDLISVKNCLEKGLKFLKTECIDNWPIITNYFETTDKDANYNEIIKVSLTQNPFFTMVIILSIRFSLKLILVIRVLKKPFSQFYCN